MYRRAQLERPSSARPAPHTCTYSSSCAHLDIHLHDERLYVQVCAAGAPSPLGAAQVSQDAARIRKPETGMLFFFKK
jgi:hypothetical protein